MRITIAPSDTGVIEGQPTTSVERPKDDLHPSEVVEMFASALIAYGCDEESICAAFEHYLNDRVIALDDENMAHC